MRKLIFVFMLFSAATLFAQSGFSGKVDKGNLRVISSIAGNIFIDGEDTGITVKAKGSAQFKSLVTGTTEVAVIAPTGETVRTIVLIEAGKTAEANVNSFRAPEDLSFVFVETGPQIETRKLEAYYVQVIALNRESEVEGWMKKIQQNVGYDYTTIVKKSFIRGRTYYRIMFGPYSLSESKTIQDLFKEEGYRDAFILKSE